MEEQRILHEMGLTPLWVLRGEAEEAAVAAEAAAESAPVAATSPRREPLRAAPEGAAAAVAVPAVAVRGATPSGVAAMDWDELEAAVAGCRACGLWERRKQAVFGVGDRRPDWLCIGEGPGADEDEQGEPFVGQAGKLLDAMLGSVDLARGRGVYIGNAVKCRPPGNRTPEAEEMAACHPYLARQIALLQPKLILLLGRAAVHSVLGLDRPLASLRGRRHEYLLDGRTVPVAVTYHPAYLLRNLTEKSRAWEDLCYARRLLAESRRGA